jgi:putative DNA primase/helicase
LTFVSEVFDDTEVATFVQTVAGYTLTGECQEHLLAFLYGAGSNGQSVFLEALLGVFGDYALKCNAELLLARKHEAHPTERADLHGKRFVAAVECDAGRRFAESLLKELTGGDTIRARRMREDFWEFTPSHTIWLASNYKPVVTGTDDGFWHRIKLIPFLNQWDTDGTRPELPAADKHLLARIRDEGDGILSWLINGLSRWQQDGLTMPQSIASAVKDYRHESDVIGQFIDECCVVSPEHKIRGAELYEAYRKWCERSGIKPFSNTAFGRDLGRRGFEKQQSRGVWRVGIALHLNTSGNSW